MMRITLLCLSLTAFAGLTGCTEAQPVCGNGKVEAGEACDDGNELDTDACTSACEAARCGDGIVQEGEDCDGGEGCVACGPMCGDGIVVGWEECDDGNYEANDACDDCERVQCGDLVFDESAGSPQLITDKVGDFTLPLNGARSWTFSQAFNGCDSYHFVFSDAGVGYSTALIASDLRGFFVELPVNSHVFFGSYNANAEQTSRSIRGIQTQVEEALSRLSPAARSGFDGRIHYIMQPVQSLEGPIGDLARRDPRGFLNYSFSIDRFGRLREHGLLRDPTQQDSAVDIRWIAEEAKGFNFEFDRHQRLTAEDDVEIVTLTEALPHRGGNTTFEVDLPSSERLAGFDTMGIDMLMDCPDHTHENCNPWDYSAPLFLCSAAMREGCPPKDAQRNCTPRVSMARSPVRRPRLASGSVFFKWRTETATAGGFQHTVPPTRPFDTDRPRCPRRGSHQRVQANNRERQVDAVDL